MSRKTAFRLLPSVSGIVPLETLKWITGRRTIFPFYHLVSDETVPHVKFLYPVRNTKEFNADLEFFLKHYKPVGIADILHCIKSDRPLPENSFLLTFDDGLREFHDIVTPILLRKGIPATCFLNSAFVDNRDLFYRYKASLLIGRLQETDPSILQHQQVGAWFREHHLPEIQNPDGLLQVTYANRHLLDERFGLFERHEILLTVPCTAYGGQPGGPRSRARIASQGKNLQRDSLPQIGEYSKAAELLALRIGGM